MSSSLPLPRWPSAVCCSRLYDVVGIGLAITLGENDVDLGWQELVERMMWIWDDEYMWRG
ncbi:hypothetical protein [Bacillus sp. 3255]|uniref:hypothetical protein n=1 Tax=Bacillus sp. 3255 TaxID=2817904 RepID=UPI00285E7DCC|nr:hypothetical protein [Bacillus sp. 3255]MDR6878720.1 hypothetical protein [Bacillus sp. 3255]